MYENLTKLEQLQLIQYKLKTDRQFFFEYILSHYIQTDTIGEVHKEWFRLLSTEEKLGIVAPRSHAKSSIINIADNLFDICNHGKSVNQPYIVIFSDTPEQAVDHLASIVSELEGNERILMHYGKLYEPRKIMDKTKDKWTQNTIITNNGVKVEAKGWRSKTRGMRWGQHRPSKIVIDDIENDDDVFSDKMREKLKNTFESKILNLGGLDTKYRFVGTILHFDSLLLNEITTPRLGWTWKRYDALSPEGKALWPEWWSAERLDNREKEIGSINFQKEFMNNPLDPASQVLHPVAFYESIDLTMLDCYGYIDLAISEKETADYTAVVTIGRERNTGKLYVIEPIQIRGSVQEQLDLVQRLHQKYKYKGFGVETVAYQKAFAQLLIDNSRKTGVYIPVIEEEQDKDKVRRAVDISVHVENGTVLFNAGYQEFMAQIVQFPKSAHDDMVDAFTGAVRMALRHNVGLSTVGSAATSFYPKNY